MKNNRFYCYLNACLQCLAPITEMRDHYLTQTYAGYKELQTLRDNFDYSNGMYLFYKAMFRTQGVVDVQHLKTQIIKKFHPI